MAAFSHKSTDDNYLLSTGYNCGLSDTFLPSRVPMLTFIQPSGDFYTTSPLTDSATSDSLEAHYIHPGTNTVVPRETEELYSLQRLDSREIDEDIHRLFVETNAFAIDELYNNNNNPPDVSMISDEATPRTDSKVVVEDIKRRKSNRIQYRACQISSRMVKPGCRPLIAGNASTIKPCRASAASTKEKSDKGKKIIESAPSKQPAMQEPAKDFVMVRARRGQATDRHSIAERVRREKIRKRMNYLQDLVPGCCKGTGKTVVLDEIINYVKSLQNQVEFLSMKLSAASPRYDFSLEPGNHDLGSTVPRPSQEYGGDTVQGATPIEPLLDPFTDKAWFSFAKESESTGADECDPQLHGWLRQQDPNHGMARDLGFSEHH